MKIVYPIAFLLIAALVAGGCSDTSDTDGKLSERDIAQLTDFAIQDAPNLLARDWEGMASEYTEDAFRLPPNAPTLFGREAILASLETLPEFAAFDFQMVDLQGDGQIAYMHATWSASVILPDLEDPITDAGKILIVFRKQHDGIWKRVADAWNSDLPAN